VVAPAHQGLFAACLNRRRSLCLASASVRSSSTAAGAVPKSSWRSSTVPSAVVASLGDWADRASWWVAVCLFLIIAAIETVWPERRLRNPTATRWAGHFALYATCWTLLVLAAPGKLASDLAIGEDRRFLFTALGQAGEWNLLLGGILLSDLLMYFLHRTQHRVFLLWRFHAVHHADTDVDVTTALRHHPGEFLPNSFVATFVPFALGAPVWLFPVYGLLSFTASLFQHMNAAMPARLDRLLGLLIVTPGMHRVHHSVLPEHYGANFGTVFSFWDRLFRTYRRLDREQREALAFGIPEFTAPRYSRAYWAWILPFALSRGGPASHQGLAGHQVTPLRAAEERGDLSNMRRRLIKTIDDAA
jgi:sterol desaturase/sphingolipid hydroxylase (fatty acid hydroxylase superfamily)